MTTPAPASRSFIDYEFDWETTQHKEDIQSDLELAITTDVAGGFDSDPDYGGKKVLVAALEFMATRIAHLEVYVQHLDERIKWYEDNMANHTHPDEGVWR